MHKGKHFKCLFCVNIFHCPLAISPWMPHRDWKFSQAKSLIIPSSSSPHLLSLLRLPSGSVAPLTKSCQESTSLPIPFIVFLYQLQTHLLFSSPPTNIMLGQSVNVSHLEIDSCIPFIPLQGFQPYFYENYMLKCRSGLLNDFSPFF